MERASGKADVTRNRSKCARQYRSRGVQTCGMQTSFSSLFVINRWAFYRDSELQTDIGPAAADHKPETEQSGISHECFTPKFKNAGRPLVQRARWFWRDLVPIYDLVFFRNQHQFTRLFQSPDRIDDGRHCFFCLRWFWFFAICSFFPQLIRHSR